MKVPLRVAVTGAAGQIGYALLFRLAAGQVFGPDQPVILQLVEIPNEKAMHALEGVAMELDDCAFPLLHSMILTSDPAVGFEDANWCLMLGAKPRTAGMERADLLQDNGKVFIAQGRIIDAVAADNARVVVVGNPANTNTMIAASQAKRLPPERFTAMVRLDQNRAITQLARKSGQNVSFVSDLYVFGNHSPSIYPAFHLAKINGRPVPKIITDSAWLQTTFCQTVGQRGAAIIVARGASSTASGANALVDHVRDLITPGAVHSMGVKTNGAYGFDPDVWAGLPVRTTTPGNYEIVMDFPMDAFARQKIAASNKELMEERQATQSLLK